MEATHVSPSPITTAHTHPLLLVAAASVTVLSLAGVGALAGWLPGPGTHSVEPAKVAAAAPAPISIQQTVSVPQEKARPAASRAPNAARRIACAARHRSRWPRPPCRLTRFHRANRPTGSRPLPR
jgi:hypothetical protein